MFQNPVAIIFLSVSAGILLFIIAFLIHQFRYVIWSGYMRVVFVGEDRRTSSAVIKADESDKDFEIQMWSKVFKYGLDRNRIYRSGRFRIPTAYYKFGIATPIDMLDTNIESETSALDYAQVARNTVTRDLLAAFDTSFLNAQNIFILTIIVIGVGLLALGLFTNSKFEKLEQFHIEPTPSITAPPDTGVDNLKDQLN